MAFSPGIGQKILITGASGFIGSQLYNRLRTTESEIYAVSRTSHPSSSPLVHWSQIDLEDTQAVEQLISAIKPEVIFHLASYVTASPQLSLVMPTLSGCLLTTVNLLTAATASQSCRRFIVVGSGEEGDSDLATTPTSPYAAAKLAASSYARMFHQLYQLPTVITRPFMTFGPGQSQNKLIPYIITCILENKPSSLSSGSRAVDWIYIDDVVDGLIAAAMAPNIEGCTIDLGTGLATSIQTVADLIVKLMEAEIEPIYGALPDRPLERSIVANIAHTRKVLGWEPRTSLEQGLEQTIRWYKNHLRNNYE